MKFKVEPMCRKKAYTEDISNFAEDLNIRIVYSSLPEFMDQYMGKIRKENKECSFRERIITQEEAQIINVDDVSVELDITIEDIISKKVYVINGFADFTDYETTLYIGAYFTAFIFRLRGKRFNYNSVAKIADILDVSKFSDLLDITSYTCRLLHAVVVSESDLWNVLDQEAFPNVGENTINRQISETYTDELFEIDLNRDLRKALNEEYISHIMTMVHLPISKKEIPNMECIEKAIHAAEKEATLCFSEQL